MRSSLLSKEKTKAITEHRYYPLILSVSSGLLMSLGWPVMPFPFLLFIGFAPLFAIEEHIANHSYRHPGRKFFWHIYLALFLWNLLTTWWVYNSTVVGALFMLFANAFLMTIPFVLFRLTKRAAGANWGYFGFVLYWITFEYIHLNWDISWPWLTLGNGFASVPEWVQWYEYTGVFGGTIWLLLANLAFFFIFLKDNAIFRGLFRWRSLIYALLWIVMPVVFSYILYYNYEAEGREVEAVVLQPNIDPFTEKFAGSENFIPYEEQVAQFIHLSETQLTDSTDFVVWPESAFDGVYYEPDIQSTEIFEKVISFKERHPQLALVTGLTSYRIYEEPDQVTPTARFRENVGYFDVFNTALFLNDQNDIVFYHKSKLVPGVEIMPYPQVFGFLTEAIFNLGGTSGGFGRQEERTVFRQPGVASVAPAICYESIYGDYMAEYIRNGANLIFIITNDGWWGNTPGHKQHLAYATLRAVEFRRSIARSANTGISAFINQRGDISQATPYWTQEVIRGTIQASNRLTFYARHGDYLARTAAWLAVLVLLAALVKKRIIQ